MDNLINKAHCMDCFELLAQLPDASIDMFATDLPYGTTACAWDEIIPFAPMWKEVKRTLKPRGAFVTTSSQPFTSKLIMSNPRMFRYEWIWDKKKGANFYQANFAPLKSHENILVFSDSPCVWNQSGWMNYYPQKTEGQPYMSKMGNSGRISSKRKNYKMQKIETSLTGRYPLSIQTFSNDEKIHPTQKPVALYEYLIRTYTQPNDVVCDFCCGSGTTGVAARNTGRWFTINDNSQEYFEVATKRLAEPFTPSLFG